MLKRKYFARLMLNLVKKNVSKYKISRIIINLFILQLHYTFAIVMPKSCDPILRREKRIPHNINMDKSPTESSMY